MEPRRGILWYFVNGAMELSWLSAWLVFLTTVTLARPYPVMDGVATFVLAAALTRLATGRGWRIVTVLGLYLAGMAGAAALTIHRVYGFPGSPLDTGWLAALAAGLKRPGDWLNFYFQILLVVILWRAGQRLARRPGGYLAVCNRFDYGLAAFFLLFLIRLVIQLKSEAQYEDPHWMATLLAFFIFGLLAMGLGRLRGAAARVFLPGYRGLGVIAGFATVVLLGAGGLFLFCLPALTIAAEISEQALKTAGSPFLHGFLIVVRWMFAPRSIRSDPPQEHADIHVDWSAVPTAAHDGWLGVVEKIVAWGVGGILILVAATAIALILFTLLKRLLERTARQADHGEPESLAARLAALRAFLGAWRRAVLRLLRRRRTGVDLYGALLGWGRRSGLPRLRSETPREFAGRLAGRFPALSPQFACLVGALHREVYAERPLNAAELGAARAAWRNLRNPLHWPARLRNWFSSPP